MYETHLLSDWILGNITFAKLHFTRKGAVSGSFERTQISVMLPDLNAADTMEKENLQDCKHG